MNLAQVRNWHYYVYTGLGGIAAVLVLIQTGVIAHPSWWVSDDSVYVAVASSFLAWFLPRIQTATGPGAPPLLSPPAKPPAS